MTGEQDVAGGQARKLVLVRHAKSAWPDVPDHERPLARRGQRDAPGVGRWLRRAGCLPDLVLCSTARRAEQTWQSAAAQLQASPPALPDDRVYRASAAGLLGLIRLIAPATRTLLVVGHDPAVPELAFMLAATAAEGRAASTGGGLAPSGPLARMRAKFPTAAVAVLDFTGTWPLLGPGQARLDQFVTPRDMPS
ncbi:MAG: histidine phosphatase family protein [Actinomycetota bacterium]|nr:histidine phosphatase family protein [Actinomycetota bacterium]